MDQVEIDYKSAVYTHSSWIDLALSFGWLGMLLLLASSHLLCLLACVKKYRGAY
jgi:hypothetical protein